MYKRRRISFFYTSTNRGDITSRRLVSLFVIVLLWLFFVSTSGSSYLILAKNQQQIMALSSPPSSSFTTTADTSYTINNIIPSILCDRIYGKEIIVLEGASLIDGTGAPLKSHVVIVINGSRIITVTSESEFHKCYDSSSSRNSSNNNNINNIVNSSDYTSAVVLNLTGKYIIPGLFDMHAHVAGVLKEDSYNQSKSEKMLSLL